MAIDSKNGSTGGSEPRGEMGTPEPPSIAQVHPGSTSRADPSAEASFFKDSGAEDEVDPELVRLPRRRRRRRHPLVSLAVIGLSLYLMYFVREDFLYYLQPRRAVDLGDVGTALREGRIKPNTHVRLRGEPDRKDALILEGRLGGYESFFRLLQTSDRVFVEQHRATRATDTAVSNVFSGQLVRFDSLPYHAAVATYFAKTVTEDHDLELAKVAEAKAKGAATGLQVVPDRSGAPVEITGATLVWISVAYPNEWWIQFKKQSYATRDDAAKALEGLNLPLEAEEDASATLWRFVVHAEPEQMPSLLARFKDRSLNAEVIRRQVSYSARWNQLSVEDRVLVVNAADPTFPSRYTVETSPGGGARLVPVKDTPTRVPASAILFITVSSPLRISPGALVLLDGRAPGGNWYYLVLCVLLLGFVLLNSAGLVQRLRARPAA